ncbi:hypothetical protein BDW22DRAFT_1427535 [Trametopsis cervina]|nr:hypothetical protein BDW22DRAFT_1427535 [Trametopsis cervina]
MSYSIPLDVRTPSRRVKWGRYVRVITAGFDGDWQRTFVTRSLPRPHRQQGAFLVAVPPNSTSGAVSSSSSTTRSAALERRLWPATGTSNMQRLLPLDSSKASRLGDTPLQSSTSPSPAPPATPLLFLPLLARASLRQPRSVEGRAFRDGLQAHQHHVYAIAHSLLARELL